LKKIEEKICPAFRKKIKISLLFSYYMCTHLWIKSEKRQGGDETLKIKKKNSFKIRLIKIRQTIHKTLNYLKNITVFFIIIKFRNQQIIIGLLSN